MVWARMTDGRFSNGSPMPMKTAVEHSFSSQSTAFVNMSKADSLAGYVFAQNSFLQRLLRKLLLSQRCKILQRLARGLM